MTTPSPDFERNKMQSISNHEPPDPGLVQIPRRNLVIVAFVILAMAVGIGYLVSKLSDKNVNSPGSIASLSNSKTTQNPYSVAAFNVSPANLSADHIIKVYVTGEVQNPGVYEMKPGDRLTDAISLAGGFSSVADKTGLDLAQRVRDEMEINIPRLNPSSLPAAVGTAIPAVTPILISLPATVTPAAGSVSLVNINTASASELDKLPGIGATLSQRIVDYRTKNGPFKNLDDLKKVAGITKGVIDKIKDLISF